MQKTSLPSLPNVAVSCLTSFSSNSPKKKTARVNCQLTGFYDAFKQFLMGDLAEDTFAGFKQKYGSRAIDAFVRDHIVHDFTHSS